MRPGIRKVVQAQQAFRDATPTDLHEPGLVVSLAPLTVTWRGAPTQMPYAVGLSLTVGQSVVVVYPKTGVPFVICALTGP